MGSWIVEALWDLNSHLGVIEGELVASQEVVLESAWLLHWSVVYNLCQIEMTLVVQRDWSWDEGEPEVGGSEGAEELEGPDPTLRRICVLAMSQRRPLLRDAASSYSRMSHTSESEETMRGLSVRDMKSWKWPYMFVKYVRGA